MLVRQSIYPSVRQSLTLYFFGGVLWSLASMLLLPCPAWEMFDLGWGEARQRPQRGNLSVRTSIRLSICLSVQRDRGTDGQTDKASYKVACPQLERRVFFPLSSLLTDKCRLLQKKILIGKKVKVSLRLFDIFEKKRVFIFLCGSCESPPTNCTLGQNW